MIWYDTTWYDTIWYDMIRTFMYTFIMIRISLCILWYILIYYTHIKPLRTYYIIANIFRRVDLNMVDIGCRRTGSTLCHATCGPGDPVCDMENHQVVARIVVGFPMICGENPSKSGKRIQFCRSTRQNQMCAGEKNMFTCWRFKLTSHRFSFEPS